MDANAADLAKYLTESIQQTPPTSRLLVGLSGIPASGKSTFAKLIVDKTNALLQNSALKNEAVLVGLDGWHLTRAQLSAFPDPKLAHDRRGIHWTFDAVSYLLFIQSLRLPISTSTSNTVITAPSFDHALKDPTPDAISIYPHHRIVVIEGLYCFLHVYPWDKAGLLLDERWWIDVDEEEGKRRLVTRHVVSGVAKDMQEAMWRADENDIPNGRFIMANMLEPTKRIKSIDDPVFSLN